MVARVCVVGSVNADLTFTVDSLPRPGQTVLASSLSSAPGGKGGNQAVAAARAGAAVQLVAALLMRGPSYLATVRRELAEWLEQHEYDSLRQAHGSMSLLRSPAPEAFERGNYMRALQGWRAGS